MSKRWSFLAAALLTLATASHAMGPAGAAVDPTLIWEFDAGTQSLTPTVGVGTPTVTRAGNTATRVNALGFIEIVNANLPRFDFDPITLGLKGLLVEEARTNIALQSADYSTTWTNFASSESVNLVASPDGGVNADAIIEDGTNATHGVQQSITYSNATAYTMTVYLKANTRTWAWVFFPSSAFTATSGSYFNLGAGTLGTVIGTGVTATITAAGNGWYRCAITKTSTAAAAGNTGFGLATADNTNSYAGDSVSGIYAWGAQVEVGAFASSLVPTAAASGVRAAEAVTVATASITGFSSTTLTVLTEAYAPANDAASFARPVSINDGTSAEEIAPARSSGVGRGFIFDGGVNQFVSTGTQAWTLGTLGKVAMAVAANDAALIVNGGTAVTDTSLTLPTVTSVSIGSTAGVGAFWTTGHIRRVRIYNVRKPDTFLQTLTTSWLEPANDPFYEQRLAA